MPQFLFCSSVTRQIFCCVITNWKVLKISKTFASSYRLFIHNHCKMNDPRESNNLETLLSVHEVRKDVFVNSSELYKPIGSRGLYGGTLVGQALWSSTLTVPEIFHPHSLHSYFISAALPNKPIEYHVVRLRDGKSFISREIKAYQDGTLVYQQNVSFYATKTKRPVTGQLQHSKPFPHGVDIKDYHHPVTVRKQSKLTGIQEPKKSKLKPSFEGWYKNGPIENLFPTKFYDLEENDNKPHEETENFFVRVRQPIKDPRFHYAALAYYTDSFFLVVGMKFHKRKMFSAAFSVSLDHVIYFHKPTDTNDWKLYHVTHPRSINARKLMYGEIYDDQECVATVIQEGLVTVADEPNTVNEDPKGLESKL